MGGAVRLARACSAALRCGGGERPGLLLLPRAAAEVRGCLFVLAPDAAVRGAPSAPDTARPPSLSGTAVSEFKSRLSDSN